MVVGVLDQPIGPVLSNVERTEPFRLFIAMESLVPTDELRGMHRPLWAGLEVDDPSLTDIVQAALGIGGPCVVVLLVDRGLLDLDRDGLALLHELLDAVVVVADDAVWPDRCITQLQDREEPNGKQNVEIGSTLLCRREPERIDAGKRIRIQDSQDLAHAEVVLLRVQVLILVSGSS